MIAKLCGRAGSERNAAALGVIRKYVQKHKLTTRLVTFNFS